jgi:microcystin-dependent protein
MTPYLGCVILFGGNFAINGFQTCSGQLLSIAQNAAVFSLLGTFYGGNGTSTFALPDLRGRTAVQQGQGPGLSTYDIGESIGATSVTLLSSNIPAHNHQVNVFNGSTEASSVNSPAGAFFGEGPKSGSGPAGKSPDYYISGTAPNTTLSPQAITVNAGGGSIPVSVVQPFLAVTHLIAMRGVFPARN